MLSHIMESRTVMTMVHIAKSSSVKSHVLNNVMGSPNTPLLPEVYAQCEVCMYGCRTIAAALTMQMKSRPYIIIDGVAENPSSPSETWKKKLCRNQRNGKRISPLNPRCFANQQHVWAVVVTVVACERYIHFSSLFWASIHCNLSQVVINVCSALCYIHVVDHICTPSSKPRSPMKFTMQMQSLKAACII